MSLLNVKCKNELALSEGAGTKVVEWVNCFWNKMVKKKVIEKYLSTQTNELFDL